MKKLLLLFFLILIGMMSMPIAATAVNSPAPIVAVGLNAL